MKSSLNSLAAIVLAFSALPCSASPYINTGQYFVQPAGWNVGDSDSTYQAWDTLTATTGNLPTAGYITNPSIATNPTLNVSSPGFRTGSGNFYSFSGDYGIHADIPNHNVGGTLGTHVIVQTAATTNNLVSVVAGSMKIVDTSGAALVGGSNGQALVSAAALAAGRVNSHMGSVGYGVQLWEFYLPNYSGDFRVRWTEVDASSFDQLRVDTFLSPNALPATPFTFQVIPEPTALALVLSGLVGLVARPRHTSSQT
jgi:hypothetical protein